MANSWFYTKRECRLLNLEKRPERQQKSMGIESNLPDSHCLCSEKLFTVRFLREFGIKVLPNAIRIVETHAFNKNLVYLGSYNQFQSNANLSLVHECHGLILGKASIAIVLTNRPRKKFRGHCVALFFILSPLATRS
jgi:hypothetical protein